ncbi:MAG: hypothetical protein IT373_24555 [Polyangiaceae bacterium]|nr:hypothetical protein [Polyangiaceae bacterium]
MPDPYRPTLPGARVHVFAASGNSPLVVAEDARLRGGEGPQTDQSYGQAGWHWGINFETLMQLVMKLWWSETPDHLNREGRPLGPHGNVSQLAIMVHGQPNALDVEGKASHDWASTEADTADLRGATVARYATELTLLEKILSEDAILHFMACRAGQLQGAAQEDLLVNVSRYLPNRAIVGYTTFGWVATDDMKRPGGWCEPGMRETWLDGITPSPPINKVCEGATWFDLARLPWASVDTPYARVVRDGVELKSGWPDSGQRNVLDWSRMP